MEPTIKITSIEKKAAARLRRYVAKIEANDDRGALAAQKWGPNEYRPRWIEEAPDRSDQVDLCHAVARRLMTACGATFRYGVS